MLKEGFIIKKVRESKMTFECRVTHYAERSQAFFTSTGWNPRVLSVHDSAVSMLSKVQDPLNDTAAPPTVGQPAEARGTVDARMSAIVVVVIVIVVVVVTFIVVVVLEHLVCVFSKL